MKKIFFILAAAAMVACQGNNPVNPEEDKNTTFAKARYFEILGTNTVPNVEGENSDQPFTMDSVRAEVLITTDSTVSVNLYQINFSSKMPVTIDMTIPDVAFSRLTNGIVLSGDNIIPMMGSRPVDRYLISHLDGSLTADSFRIVNNYGPYQGCIYAGAVTKMLESN